MSFYLICSLVKRVTIVNTPKPYLRLSLNSVTRFFIPSQVRLKHVTALAIPKARTKPQYELTLIKLKEITKQWRFKNKFITHSWLLLLYLEQTLSALTQFSSIWHFVDISALGKKENFYLLWYRLYRKQRLRLFYTSKKFFLNWFIQLTYFKDTKGIIPLFRKLLLKTHLKKHKRTFYFISNFFKIWYAKMKKKTKIKGYTLFFKGKLGRKGSVRKSKFFVKQGLTSFTNKQLRINYETYYIWTHTGVVGAGISIFF